MRYRIKRISALNALRFASYLTGILIILLHTAACQNPFADNVDQSEIFSGNLDTNRKSWTIHAVELDIPGLITAKLDWDNPSADMNLFLYDPSGKLVKYANTTTAKPEVVQFDAPDAGRYEIGIKCKEGNAVYLLSLDVLQQKADVIDYAGRPERDKLFWGAAVSGNGDPVNRHEIPAGHALAVRRTFFQWNHRTGYMIKIASEDLANGRLPWVSIKPPAWTEMAAGIHDHEIDEMLTALKTLPGPVWLTIHHEPEGGGGKNYPDDPAGASGHLAMNRRVRDRIDALALLNDPRTAGVVYP